MIFTKHIVFYSGGIGSWATAKRVIAQQGKENTILLFTDTLIEDEDLYRFIDETVAEMGCEYYRIADGRTPFEVYKDVRFLGNSRLAPCSHKLKQEPAKKWITANFAPDQCVLYLGIDWTEEHRTAAPRRNWSPYEVRFPMCEEPYVDKSEMIAELERLGIKQPRLYAQGYSHNNCFHGNERFITDEGVFSFKEKLGQNVKVLGERGHWQDAEVKYFGKQELIRLTISKQYKTKEILTTANHRWFIRKNRKDRKEVLTHQLQPGDRLWGMHQSVQTTIKPSPFAIAQGIVFGDGTYPHNTWNNPATVTLCGEKIELLKYFPLSDVKEVKDVGVKVCDLPKAWKGYPSLDESKSVLLGWLMGYFAADGSATGSQVTIASSSKEHLEFVQKVCLKVGISTNEITWYMRKGYGKEETPLYSIAFVPCSVPPDFFIREKHRIAFECRPKLRPGEWQVVSVEPTGIIDDVYCAVVPTGHAFTLEGNIYTGNCGGGCCRAGQGHWAHVLETRPEVFAEWERMEEDMRQYLDKDVSMLKRIRKGVTYPLTLRQLREELQAKQTEQIDFDDIGGCGCFSTEEE